VAGNDRCGRRALAIERDVHEVETKREAELFAGQMRLRARPARGEAVFDRA